MKPSVVCFSLAAALVARSDGRFTVLRSSAEPLGGLSAFLEKYIGACGPGSAPQCESAASSFRSHANAKRFFFAAGDEAASLLSAGRFDEATGEWDLKLTPFFAAGPYALTQGTPRETDAAGNPLIPLIVLRGKAPEGFSASRLQRLISARELRIELVFTPQAVWTLPSKRGGRIRGVRSRIDGLQVLSVRTGEVLASWP
ncbi:MAG TPA: DUF6066 family protein [Myxococcaceae bacterium]|nr:DUF6066 family protein [Myxococcaceae bacterium]